MTLSLTHFFKKYPQFLLTSLAVQISGIGSALTLIVVYAELNRMGAGALQYALAFAFGVLPGLFTTHLSRSLSARLPMARILIFCEILGAVSLSLPLAGLMTGSIPLLLAIEAIGSLTAGLVVPLQDTYMRVNIEEDDLAKACEVSNWVFCGIILIGQVLGTACYLELGSRAFLALDLASYLIAAVLIGRASRKYPRGFDLELPLGSPGSENRPHWNFKGLDWTRRKAFAIGPFLALVCTPCMALLPTIGGRYSLEVHAGFFALSPVLLLILAKTFGQMAGPFALAAFQKRSRISDRKLIWTCLLAFLVLYGLAFQVNSLFVSLVLVFSAHVSSNMVFMLASTAFAKSFQASEMMEASTARYRLILVAMAGGSLWAGWVGQEYGALVVVFVSAGLLLGGGATLLLMSRPESAEGVHA